MIVQSIPDSPSVNLRLGSSPVGRMELCEPAGRAHSPLLFFSSGGGVGLIARVVLLFLKKKWVYYFGRRRT